jgi:transposase
MEAPACQGCAALMALVEQLRAEVAQVRAALAAAKKNSSNSSKPPSSDIVKKPKVKLKDGNKRRRGGQPKHPRHERAAFPPDRVDDHFEFMLHECPDCHGPVVPSRQAPKIIRA